MRPLLHWRTFFVALIAAYAVLTLAAVGFVYFGFFDIAADVPHWQATRWVMETARIRSIKAHAVGIAVPRGLDTSAELQMGVEHFAMHCAVCHGAPGVPHDDIAEGLYPAPPNLAMAAPLYSDAELFWILKHGIKMTGMPSWADHSDEELWAIVAFLKKLPGMSEADYAKIVIANVMHGAMHHHGADMPGGETPQGKPATAADHDHQ